MGLIIVKPPETQTKEPVKRQRRTARGKLEKTVADTRPNSIKIRVEFTLSAPGARSVSVAGSFNNWDPKRTPMVNDGAEWKAALELLRGRYEYKFLVDGAWLTDSAAPEIVPTPFGGFNSVFSI